MKLSKFTVITSLLAMSHCCFLLAQTNASKQKMTDYLTKLLKTPSVRSLTCVGAAPADKNKVSALLIYTPKKAFLLKGERSAALGGGKIYEALYFNFGLYRKAVDSINSGYQYNESLSGNTFSQSGSVIYLWKNSRKLTLVTFLDDFVTRNPRTFNERNGADVIGYDCFNFSDNHKPSPAKIAQKVYPSL